MTLTLRGHIENGRIVVDEGVNLPEGTEVKLTLVDDADDLTDEDRAPLHAALDASQVEIDRGEGTPAPGDSHPPPFVPSFMHFGHRCSAQYTPGQCRQTSSLVPEKGR
jgi:hypothetical protein